MGRLPTSTVEQWLCLSCKTPCGLHYCLTHFLAAELTQLCAHMLAGMRSATTSQTHMRCHRKLAMLSKASWHMFLLSDATDANQLEHHRQTFALPLAKASSLNAMVLEGGKGKTMESKTAPNKCTINKPMGNNPCGHLIF